MKTTLPLLMIFGFGVAVAQTPIPSLYGIVAAGFVDGTNHRTYVSATSTAAFDESASGANQTWNYQTLTAAGAEEYSNAAANFGESTTYPGTTMVSTQMVGANTSKAYFNNSSATSFTGADTNGFQLNYSTNNATIGTFPLNYGYTNSDAMAGTYVYTTYSGNFQGTINSAVDGYGTLNINDIGFGAQSYSVTRLKMVQNFTISYSIFSNAGTVTMTTYAYYRDMPGDLFPIFISTTTHIVVPLLSMDNTYSTYEAAVPALLAAPSFQNASVELWPNPVHDVLHLPGARAVSLFDLNGREILRGGDEILDVSSLASGTYLAKIRTAAGTATKKIVKE